nr:hypothetical protein [Tanacetum cinerariifolium]
MNDRYKSGKGYHVVSPPYTRTFMPPKPHLVFIDAPNASESVAHEISDSEDETEIEYVLKQKETSFVPTSEHVKTPRTSVKEVKHPKQAENLRTVNQKSRVDFLNAHAIQYALVVNPTIYVSFIKQFWASATLKKVNDVVQLRALIDEKKLVVTEDVIRQDLYLNDADGVKCLPNEEISTELARMGYEKPPPKLTFYKAFFSTQWKFLIHTLVQYVSVKRTAWNEFNCSMASVVICLATGRKFNFSKFIFDSMIRNVDSPSKFLMYQWFLQVIINNQVDDLTSHNTKYTSLALTQKVFVNMRKVEEDEEVKVPTSPTPPSPLNVPSHVPQGPIPTPLQAQPAIPPASSTQGQPTKTFKSSMPLLNTLLETCATLSQKVVKLEQDKHTQALEILKLNKRVKKLEKKTKSKSLRRMRPNRGKIEVIDADKDITLVDVKTQVDMTIIKIKVEKAKLLDEQIAKRLHDEEVKKAAAREKQEKYDLERAQVLQKQYDDKEENIDWNAIAEKIQEKHLDNIKKYQSLKRKLVSIAQARKNMIIYLKKMAGYKMEHFRGIIYDKVRPIFEREFKKVQTLFKPNKYVEEPQKKRVAKETLLQESFKKLKAVKVLGSDFAKETPTNDPKEMSEEDVQNMLEIVPMSEFKIIRVGGITEAYQSFKDMLKGFEREDLVALWRLVKEKSGSAVPNVDKEKAIWVELKRLFEPDAKDVLWKLKRDLVMKIFMEANKPKSRSLDTSSK